MYHIAEVNIARMLGATINDPIMKEFVDKLDEVNLLAEQSQGFVWRLKEEAGNATSIPFNDDPQIIVNMSVWQDLASLQHYVYKSDHRHVFTRKKEWFEHLKDFSMCL